MRILFVLILLAGCGQSTSLTSSLIDEFDNTYSIYRDHVPLLNGLLSVHPQESQICIIQAQFPIAKAQKFYLELHGSVIGSDKDLHFVILRSDIR